MKLTEKKRILLAALSIAMMQGCFVSSSSADETKQLPNPPEHTAVMIDHLEDGDHFNAFGGYWFTYDDKNNGGDSKVTPMGTFKPTGGGALDSQYSAGITGKVTTTYPNGYIGMGTDLHRPNDPVDVRKYDGIEFWARGDGKNYRFKFRSAGTSDYDDYGVDFTAPAEWTHYSFNFEQLKQQGWGKAVPLDSALKGVISVTWQTLTQPLDSVELAVDNIRFLKPAQ
jgi:hypothetical protein